MNLLLLTLVLPFSFSILTFTWYDIKMHQSILALDVGLKRVGVAFNPYGEIILELPTITWHEFADFIIALRKIINDHEVEKIVVGKPRSDSNKIVQLINKLKQEFHSINFIMIDETLTTKEAERQLGNSRADTDARAARLILEQYLNESRT